MTRGHGTGEGRLRAIKPLRDPPGHRLTAYVSAQELSYTDGEVAVDVVVTPARPKPGTWTLSDSDRMLAIRYNNLAALYRDQGRLTEADALLKRFGAGTP
jgi:hypothetical protein